MGVVVEDEEAPLLSISDEPSCIPKASKFAAEPPQLETRAWDGNLLQCCGQRCTGQGWASCAFAYFLPCFAFGFNLKRAFRASVWTHALLFFVLFYGIQRTFIVAVNVTAESCKADTPAHAVLHPHPRPHLEPVFMADATAHDSWLSGRKLLQVDDAPGKFVEAFADVLPSAETEAVILGRSAEQGSQDPSQRDSLENVERIEVVSVEDLVAEEAEPSLDCVTNPETGHQACQKHPRPPMRPHPAIMPFTDEFAMSTPGCKRAFVGLFILHNIAVAAALVGVVYAARHRTLIRQKFSIPGSPVRDFLAWLFCFPCALCQETRTLRANKVVDGQWNNALAPGQNLAAPEQNHSTVVKPPKVVEV